MSQITKPGIYDMPADDYHSDPCPAPSLSSGVAGLLLDRSPRHAWTAHPRLNPAFVSEDRKEFDLGRAAHALLLEGVDDVVIIDADSYRTKEAKAQRDDAYAAGKTPILQAKWDDVRRMAEAARAQLDATEDCQGVFEDGHAERTLICQENGVWYRVRPDWYRDGEEIIWDYKTTSGSAHPDAWARNYLFAGHDVQPALYKRAAMSLLGWRRPRFHFVVQEISPPYALSVIALTSAGEMVAERRCDKALEAWAWCLSNDTWPGYPSQIAYVEPAPWLIGRHEEREAREEMIRDLGDDPYRKMIDWQRPLEQKGQAL